MTAGIGDSGLGIQSLRDGLLIPTRAHRVGLDPPALNARRGAGRSGGALRCAVQERRSGAHVFIVSQAPSFGGSTPSACVFDARGGSRPTLWALGARDGSARAPHPGANSPTLGHPQSRVPNPACSPQRPDPREARPA